MKTLDTRGLLCPKPLILTKQALKAGEPLHILIDDELARTNISTFLTENGYAFKLDNGSLIVEGKIINKKELTFNKLPLIVVVDSELAGNGDQQLGKALMSAFLSSLKELDKLPTTLYLYNGGALLIKNAATKGQLQELQQLGISIKVCGACVNFFELHEEAKTFDTTNMLTIVQALASNHIIRP